MTEAMARSRPQLDTVRERPGGRSARIREAVLEATLESLLNEGYASLSHRVVAKRAGVDPATVYRRWPTRPRLAVDALLDTAQATVPVPDTGDVAKDMRRFLDARRRGAQPTRSSSASSTRSPPPARRPRATCTRRCGSSGTRASPAPRRSSRGRSTAASFRLAPTRTP